MAAPYPQVVLFGDSLFEQSCAVQDGFSFFGSLQNHCIRRYDVINRGFSGYNTSQAVKMLEQVFPKPEAGGPKLAYLIVLLGANDASVPRDVDNQAVPIETYKQNLTHILTHPHITAHNPRILVVVPPPVDEIRCEELDVPRRGHVTHLTAQQAEYSQAARDVAAAVGSSEQQIVVVDLQKALMEYALARTPGWEDGGKGKGGVLGSKAGGERGYLEKLLPDGLHMSGEAYRVFYELVKAEIDIPQESNQGYVHPAWTVAEWVKE